jgi:hypothetical protein
METSSSLYTLKTISELVKNRQKQAISISREEASKLIPEFNTSVQVAIESLSLDEASKILDEEEVRIKIPFTNSFLQKICVPQSRQNQFAPEEYVFYHLTELNSVGEELFHMFRDFGYEFSAGLENITIILPGQK